jgi:hypothetical protein
VIFSIATCALVGAFLGPQLLQRQVGRVHSWLVALAVVIAANLVGLTFVGMEHAFQVFAGAGCIIVVLLAFEGERVPLVLLVLAALAPAIRYEDVLFTAAAAATVWLQGRRKAAVVTMLASLLPLIALGTFLHLHGLSPFPNSVLSKSGVVTARPHLFPHLLLLDHLLTLVAVSVIQYTTHPDHYPLLILLIAFGAIVWRTTQRRRLLLPALAAGIFMIVFGPFGALNRYDSCIFFFLFLGLLWFLLNSPRYWRLGKWVLPALAAFAFLPTLVRIPVACQQIARQQYQMHRFSHDFVKKNVAVEDLGWVAFDTDGKYYLLDLVGLGSNDTLRFRNIEKNAAWLDDVTRRHDIRLVMIYHPAFPDVPSRWRKLGVLTQTPHWLNGGAASDQVTLYATNPQDFAAMRSELQRFSQTLPAGVWLEDLSR